MKILELGGAGEKETAVGAEEECVLIGLCLFVCLFVLSCFMHCLSCAIAFISQQV